MNDPVATLLVVIAFVVVVFAIIGMIMVAECVNLDFKSAYCQGAGYDRALAFGDQHYCVSVDESGVLSGRAMEQIRSE